MDEFVIQTDRLTKRYKNVVAVDDLSMEILRGRVYGLLGPNGSGKTTTMGLLLGLLKPTSGTFSLFGSPDGHEASLRRVGAIIESPAFYPYLSGFQNLKYYQIISGGGSEEEIESLIDRVGLAGRGNDRFRTYSLGMKQRLGIAYALLGDPDLVFLDEPTNGLDPEGMIEVRELIRSLGDGNRTVLLSSHLLHEVEQVCDSVAIISKGRLIAQGEVSQLVAMSSSEQIRTKTTDNSKAHQILSALDWVEDVDTHEDSLLVTAPIERSSELTAALARSEVYVAEMVPVRRSLEEYFLEVTGDGKEISQ
jgi:ABC-2 type transport system ATP-binding protein